MTSIPLVPFDPEEVGPLDLLHAVKESARRFVNENSRYLIVSGVALLLISLHFGISIPRFPNWLWVALLTFVVAVPYAVLLGIKLAAGLYQRDVEVLSAVDPATGDLRILEVDPDRFEQMAVKNQNGEVRDLDHLKTIRVNGSLAYEVDHYQEEQNVAVASWQAGETNASIRRQKSQIKRIKTSLEREADKSLELLANHPDILRKHASEVANRLIKVAEGIEVPSGGALHENLSDTIEESDPSEELLRGYEGDGDDVTETAIDEDDSDATIFDRAADRARAATAGGEDGGD